MSDGLERAVLACIDCADGPCEMADVEAWCARHCSPPQKPMDVRQAVWRLVADRVLTLDLGWRIKRRVEVPKPLEYVI